MPFEFKDEVVFQPVMTPFQRMKAKLRLMLGARIYAAFKEYESYRNANKNANWGYDRLDEFRLQSLIEEEVKSLNPKRKQVDKLYAVEKTLQGLSIPLVNALIERYGSEINIVADMACRYAFYLEVLAKAHPQVKVIGVSLATNVAEYHSDIDQPNLEFVHGYELDMLEQGQLVCDVALFSSTLILFTNAEVRRHLRALKKSTKFIVINEPQISSWDYKPVDPDTIPLDGAVPMRVFEEAKYFNYKAILKEAGFTPLHYRIFPAPADNLMAINTRKRSLTPVDIHIVQIIAKNDALIK